MSTILKVKVTFSQSNLPYYTHYYLFSEKRTLGGFEVWEELSVSEWHVSARNHWAFYFITGVLKSEKSFFVWHWFKCVVTGISSRKPYFLEVFPCFSREHLAYQLNPRYNGSAKMRFFAVSNNFKHLALYSPAQESSLPKKSIRPLKRQFLF